jgi:hypothetical protein
MDDPSWAQVIKAYMSFNDIRAAPTTECTPGVSAEPDHP